MSNLIEQFEEYFSVDNERLKSDRDKLEEISDSLPNDGVLSLEDCAKLKWNILHGMNICDFWVPKIHWILAEKESTKDKARNSAYANASSKEGIKLTVEMRKVISELDEDFESAKIELEKLKAIKMFFEKKRDSFKSALFVVRDQTQSFRLSDKGVSANGFNAFGSVEEFNEWVK